jgi:DNA invertase Pin-like site-specific DNA recombinase
MRATRRLAVSYSRFSDPKQAEGDSSERQDREYRAFCERHNLTPGKEVYADRGRSGYHDEHRTKGRLGELVAAAKDGRFDPGTVVVIEAWDRLGRLRPDRQTELVAELLRTGVSIGVCRLNDIFSEDDFGTHKWTTLAVFIQLAHQESKQKAERVAASWERRRQRAREDGTLIGTYLPAWVEKVDDGLRLIPERAAAVRRIFQLAAEGLGHTKIVAQLLAEKVKPFGEKVVSEGRTRSQFSGTWTKPYVALLLRDRRVLGEFQPHRTDRQTKREVPDGPPLVDYYPRVITDDEFNLARAAQEERRNRDKLGRRTGPRHSKYVNLFKSMLTHARDGEGFLLHNKGTSAKPELILVNARGNGGRSKCYTFPYPVFETCVLKCLEEIDPATVLPRKQTGPSRADVLRAKLANLRADIAKYQDDLKAGYSRALVDVLRRVEGEEEQVANDLQDELARTAKPLARGWKELPSLIDLIRKADDPERARLKLRPALRALIEDGRVLIVSRGSWRFVAVQFFFTGGATRHYLIAHQTAGYRRPGQTPEPLSFAEAGLPDLDLRKPEDVAKVEKLLGRLDVAEVE